MASSSSAPSCKRQRTLAEVSLEQLTACEQTGAILHRVASRGIVGTTASVGAVLQADGMLTERFYNGKREETITLGKACSEVFSGPQLAHVLRPAVELQQRALQALVAGQACEPLSIHTSAGLPAPLGAFVETLQQHLPWPCTEDDWFINLQIDGTDAVWAGVEVLMRWQNQLRSDDQSCVGRVRTGVAVGERSYHGPKTTGLGQIAEARWPGAPRTSGQVAYPLPSFAIPDEETRHQDFLERFDTFLDKHGAELGCIVFEPQWGSTFAGRPWPKKTLQEAVRRARSKHVSVLCDEIMCGLGRHGQGTLFLSDAWELQPDAVTFGKSIAAGPFPMSGVAIRRGRCALSEAGEKVVQSHTYAGASSLALLVARAVIDELPNWFVHASRMGDVFKEILGPLSDGTFLTVQGMGLMWGALFVDKDAAKRQKALSLLKEACQDEGVWPYFVPAGGCMMTPPMNVDEVQLREGLHRLARSFNKVREQMV
eukprot:TRINITY_DN38302_c0_g1_i1.p1 TRINITY_DN38302_c0_g1~~TRINITY_DN38302_c0_g1_i1.p1  ORF type:complete len:504 (+),score=79.46 TRINITY_DN38302_c0_g1_i1:63-1514(+)